MDFRNAKELLKQANEAIVQAHQVQTDALQAESRGEELEYSILFSHAQDTCMCASSELNVAMHLVDLFEVIDKRFKKLENKLLPKEIDYSEIKGLCLEARQKLNKHRPHSIGQASRISGVSPADISVLLVYLQTIKAKK